MLALEDILSELGGEMEMMNKEQGLPPGFRFHPTDEELITFYLASKVFSPTSFSPPPAVYIPEVDLNRCEPWELPDVAKMGEREWYFFSLRDRKYPTGLRTNRATGAGYWKATGKDKEVYSSSNGGASNGGNHQLLGMKKTLVFYKGRAPRGQKTKWVMHEYRLDGDFSCRHTCKEEWVICRIFHKLGEKKNGMVLQGHNSLYIQESSITSSPPSSRTGLIELQPHKPIQSLQNLNPFLINDHHHENDLKSLIPINNHSPLVVDAAVSQPFPINSVNGGYQTSFSPPRTNKQKEETNKKSPPTKFLRSLLTTQHEDYYFPNYSHDCPNSFKEQQIAPSTFAFSPKHCKTEPNFSHVDNNAPIFSSQIPFYYNNSNKNKHHHQQNSTSTSFNQSPFLFGTMDTNGGFPSTAGDANLHEMSISSAGDANLHEMSISSSSSTTTSGVQAFNRACIQQMLLDSSIKLAAGESWPTFHF